jgi:glycosyltransferase involved in cell wall biosynthesis
MPAESFINLNNPRYYDIASNNNPNVLVALPWMTFGGAETLITNFCNEINDNYNLDFVTGLNSAHEWEYKFKELSNNIYHLTNLFDSTDYYAEFISNYIKTRKIDILHIIHTSVFFKALPIIKKRNPNLKVVVTVFNDRAEHFYRAVENEEWIDVLSTDNISVKNHYQRVLKTDKPVQVIPNGINCYDIYNPALFNRKAIREEMELAGNDLAVFFIGRLSEEKNPDVFCKVAKNLIGEKNLKFFVIGDGPARQDVEKLIKDINSKSITYLGYKSEVAEYLSAADIFVLPSSIEGFPLSILEAMAMRVACVASDVGAVAEVIDNGENGFVVKPGSVQEISEVIKKLNNDKDELMRIKNNARKKVEKTYSNKLLGDNYKKLYKSAK